MTAVEIIDEIKRLPRAEQNRVIDFVRKAGEVRRLAPEELGELAKEMAEAKDPAEADRLQAEIVRGFYGGQADIARKRMRNVLPRPSSLSSSTEPPIRPTDHLTIAKPKPTPPSARERALSTR